MLLQTNELLLSHTYTSPSNVVLESKLLQDKVYTVTFFSFSLHILNLLAPERDHHITFPPLPLTYLDTATNIIQLLVASYRIQGRNFKCCRSPAVIYSQSLFYMYFDLPEGFLCCTERFLQI